MATLEKRVKWSTKWPRQCGQGKEGGGKIRPNC